MSVSTDAVSNILRSVIDFNLNKDLISAKQIKNIQINGRDVSFDLQLTYPGKSQLNDLCNAAIAAVRTQLPEVGNVSVNSSINIQTHAVQRGLQPLPNVKNIIAVASGKGGVGKSTTAVNLALALVAEGACVGLLDADIYGPSVPTMLGIAGRPETEGEQWIHPMQSYDIQAMSIGFLIDQDTPMVWRGPMVTSALEQLLKQTRWRNLDYLIVDMPPGTGDIQLTLSQKVPVTGAVIVTTPQDIALLDARKGLKMFEKVGVPILGLIENMAIHVCTNCGHHEHIFGADGGQKMANDYNIHYLGGLPLDMQIRIHADSGRPTVVADPEGNLAKKYKEIARKIAICIADQSVDMSLKFPAIVVQNT